ncbi:MAG TPA: helix-hairpin-helix domain-containing protein [Anaerolineae bacterium]|nr:helix-hairpin-helix domain-containing protein [Anaerolineae bacterium]
MELLGALIGVGVLAAAPSVPVVRSVVKAALKGGLAVAGATVAVAEVVSHQAGDLASHIRSEHASEIIVEGETAMPEEPAAETSQTAAGAAAAPSVVRPAAKMAVKSSMVLADAAKNVAGVAGAAVVAGKQKFAGGKMAETGDEDAAADAPIVTGEATTGHMVADDAPEAADDLLLIQGVGPKTAVLLNNAGITTFAQLAATPVEQLQAILDEAGPRYRVIDPTSWPVHAQQLLDAPEPEPVAFDDTDLLPILGIGPKTAGVLKAAGIGTISQLAASSVEQLQTILDEAGSRYRVIDPATWPEQAQALLADAGQG